MNEQTEKSFNRLKSTVLNDAHEQSVHRAQEVENKTNELLLKKNSEYTAAIEKKKKSAIAKAERDAHADILRAELDARTELSEYRESLVDYIFDDVKERLEKYVQTEDYAGRLLIKAQIACMSSGDGNKIIEVNPRDIPKMSGAKEAEIRGCDILGGVRVINTDKKIICDFSYDNALAETKKSFLRKSGLKIGI